VSRRISATISDRSVGLHELLALLEHGLALVVDHVVVLQQVLADLVVALLDLALGGGDGAVQPLVGDRLAFLPRRRCA
jgi:hypothetical protein